MRIFEKIRLLTEQSCNIFLSFSQTCSNKKNGIQNVYRFKVFMISQELVPQIEVLEGVHDRF